MSNRLSQSVRVGLDEHISDNTQSSHYCDISDISTKSYATMACAMTYVMMSDPRTGYAQSNIDNIDSDIWLSATE